MKRLEKDWSKIYLFRCPKCGYEKRLNQYHKEYGKLLDQQWGKSRPRILGCEECGGTVELVGET